MEGLGGYQKVNWSFLKFVATSKESLKKKYIFGQNITPGIPWPRAPSRTTLHFFSLLKWVYYPFGQFLINKRPPAAGVPDPTDRYVDVTSLARMVS
jgi:hypothetical protein